MYILFVRRNDDNLPRVSSNKSICISLWCILSYAHGVQRVHNISCLVRGFHLIILPVFLIPSMHHVFKNLKFQTVVIYIYIYICVYTYLSWLYVTAVCRFHIKRIFFSIIVWLIADLFCWCSVLQLVAYIFWTSAEPNLTCFESEKTFFEPRSKQHISFPSLSDNASIQLTVVVPAYNEEERCMFSEPLLSLAVCCCNLYYVWYSLWKF